GSEGMSSSVSHSKSVRSAPVSTNSRVWVSGIWLMRLLISLSLCEASESMAMVSRLRVDIADPPDLFISVVRRPPPQSDPLWRWLWCWVSVFFLQSFDGVEAFTDRGFEAVLSRGVVVDVFDVFGKITLCDDTVRIRMRVEVAL